MTEKPSDWRDEMLVSSIDSLYALTAQLDALQSLLVEKGIVTWAELESRQQTAEFRATAEVELAPKHADFGRVRQRLLDVIREKEQQQEHDEGGQA